MNQPLEGRFIVEHLKDGKVISRSEFINKVDNVGVNGLTYFTPVPSYQWPEAN